MTIKTQFFAWGPKFLCIAALSVSACGKQQEVRRADEAYQQALALNDIAGQRRALLALTSAEENVSEYWMQLARIDLQMGDFAAAYDHLSRAHELDRTAVPPLSMMTELTVINGRLDLAEGHLKQLAIIAPDDRSVAVARGFVALRQGNYEKAQANVDALLARNPRDSMANVLQTRILVAQKKFPEALDLLDRNLRLGDDRALLRSLGALHRYLGNWEKAAAADLRLWRLTPTDVTLAQQVVTDALRARNGPLARTVTERILMSAKSQEEAAAVLSEWVDLAPGAGGFPANIDAGVPDHSKIAFAHYLNRTGRADQAFILLGKRARALDDRANGAFNAVFAESLLLRGQARPARKILDRILSDEPDNAVALSARARLLSRSGDHRGATIDAQRLVASYGTKSEYRVLLAEIYRASDDARAAERTLWNAYRDLQGDEKLYNEVRRVVLGRGNKDDLSRLDNAYQAEKFSRLSKELA